jgi:hypothetical protein
MRCFVQVVFLVNETGIIEMVRRLFCTVLLLLLTVCLSGCAVALVGAGAAGYGYIKGDLEAVVNYNVSTTYDACLDAMDDLELPVISRQKTLLDGKIISRNSDDKKVQIKLEHVTTRQTKLFIRIGTFGNETQSQAIYDAIRANL